MRTVAILAALWIAEACMPPENLRDEYERALEECEQEPDVEQYERCVRRVDREFEPKFRECALRGCP